MRQGQHFLQVELPRILATSPDVLSRMVRVIEGLASDWHRLDERIEGLSTEIEELAKRDAGCERLMSVLRHWSDHLQRHGRRDRPGTCAASTQLLLLTSAAAVCDIEKSPFFEWPAAFCSRPSWGLLVRFHMTAGHNVLSDQAFDNALAHVGCPDRRIDRERQDLPAALPRHR